MTTSDLLTEKANLVNQLVEKYRQQQSSILDVLASYATVAEAVQTLPTELLTTFCERIDLSHGSEKFAYQLLLGNRYRRWLAAFGREGAGVAFLYLASTSDAEFDSMIKDGIDFMKLIEQCDDYGGCARHTKVH